MLALLAEQHLLARGLGEWDGLGLTMEGIHAPGRRRGEPRGADNAPGTVLRTCHPAPPLGERVHLK